MKQTLKIRLYAVLCTAFLVTELILHLPSVFATDWRRPGSQREAVEGPRSGGGGGSTSTPSYDYGAAQRAQQAAAAAEAERQRQAEAERIERERLAEEKRQKDAAFIRERDAAANSLKGSSGTALNQLKGLSGTDSSGLKGSGFDSGGTGLKGLQGSDHAAQKSRSKPVPHTDTSVVDAHLPRDGASLTAQVPELKNSPAADRINKGFQAVVNHDWPVALAWFQDALNRDPNNAALKRSVDLAQWMVDKRKTKAKGPATPLSAAIYSASHGNSAEAIRQFKLVKKENPAIASEVDSMIAVLRQRQAKDAAIAENLRVMDEEFRKLSDAAIDEGIMMLAIGNDKGAEKEFLKATLYSGGMYYFEEPPAKSKARKTK